MSEEAFFDRTKRSKFRQVLALMPGQSLDWLAAYEHVKWEQSPHNRRIGNELPRKPQALKAA